MLDPRIEQVMALRAQGVSYRKIAAQLDMHRTQVERIVKRNSSTVSTPTPTPKAKASTPTPKVSTPKEKSSKPKAKSSKPTTRKVSTKRATSPAKPVRSSRSPKRRLGAYTQRLSEFDGDPKTIGRRLLTLIDRAAEDLARQIEAGQVKAFSLNGTISMASKGAALLLGTPTEIVQSDADSGDLAEQAVAAADRVGVRLSVVEPDRQVS